MHQLFLLTSGDINLTLDGEPQTVIPPIAINIPRGTVHGFTFSAGTEGYVVTLPAADFPDLFNAPAETAAGLGQVFSVTADPALVRRFAALAQTHAGNGTFRRTLLRAEGAALAAQLLDKELQIHGRRMIADPRVQRFAAMVRETMRRRLGLQDLASALALSPRQLGRLCKAETGMTAQGYIEAQKMREACRLLVYTRMSAQAIGWQLGYDDPSYFSRVFQRNLHQSPSAYRARFDG